MHDTSAKPTFLGGTFDDWNDISSHRGTWRQALEARRDASLARSSEEGGAASYDEHEIAVFDRVFDFLETLVPVRATLDGTFSALAAAEKAAGWVVVDPAGVVQWQTARATEEESMRACFGNRASGGRGRTRDHWQDSLDAGWKCIRISAMSDDLDAAYDRGVADGVGLSKSGDVAWVEISPGRWVYADSDKALALGKSVSHPAPRAGYVLLPVEPTEAMLDAMHYNPSTVRRAETILEKYRGRYDQLLAAAPDLPDDPNSWERNVEALLDGCSATIRCCEGGGPEDLRGSLALTFGRLQSRLDAARMILDGIGAALESRGFANMTNGESIGHIIDDVERVRTRAGVVVASASERFPDGRQAVDGPALARLALALRSSGEESSL